MCENGHCKCDHLFNNNSAELADSQKRTEDLDKPNLFLQELEKQMQSTKVQLQSTNVQLQSIKTQLDFTNSALILATRQLQEEKQNTQIELAKLKRQVHEEKQQSRSLLERLIRLEKNLIL